MISLPAKVFNFEHFVMDFDLNPPQYSAITAPIAASVVLPSDPAVARVADYRAYVFETDGHITRSILLDCKDDSAAIEATKRLVDGLDVELWQRSRMIARFDGKPKNTITGWLRGELKPPE